MHGTRMYCNMKGQHVRTWALARCPIRFLLAYVALEESLPYGDERLREFTQHLAQLTEIYRC
jgi:hypothetical protein